MAKKKGKFFVEVQCLGKREAGGKRGRIERGKAPEAGKRRRLQHHLKGKVQLGCVDSITDGRVISLSRPEWGRGKRETGMWDVLERDDQCSHQVVGRGAWWLDVKLYGGRLDSGRWDRECQVLRGMRRIIKMMALELGVWESGGNIEKGRSLLASTRGYVQTYFVLRRQERKGEPEAVKKTERVHREKTKGGSVVQKGVRMDGL